MRKFLLGEWRGRSYRKGFKGSDIMDYMQRVERKR